MFDYEQKVIKETMENIPGIINQDAFVTKLNGKKIFTGQNILPREYDIAVTSCDSSGHRGALNSFVLDDLGYNNEVFPKASQLKSGYAWLEEDKLKPVIFVVTVNSWENGETVALALENNFYKALNEFKDRIINKSLWVPLMGTGAGALRYKDSIIATIKAIIRFDKTLRGVFPCEFHLSFPPDIKPEMIETYDDIILEMIEKIDPTEVVPINLDNPTWNDQLGHRDYAKSIARHIQQIWKDSEIPGEIKPGISNGTNPGKENHSSAFMFHIYGPWGSGKSTLLNFLREELQNPADKDIKKKWVVIEFNAWQYHHIDPPWWPLITTVFKQANNQLWKNFKIKGKFRSLWIRVKAFFAKLLMGREHLPITIACIFLLIFFLFIMKPSLKSFFNNSTKETINQWESIVKIITSLFALAGFFWAISKKISLSLVNSSSSAAQSFLKYASDALNTIKKYFKKMVKMIKQPVAIFIDDLDRCNPEYVVRLLEGIQTLFRDNQILYVVAADRRWISICFEKCYNEFSVAIKKPGQRLGDLFVEKAFQLAMRVPRISSSDKANYLDYLLLIKKQDEKEQDEKKQKFLIKDTQTMLDDLFKNEVTDDGILKKYNAALEKGIPKHIARKKVLEKLSSQVVRETLKHAIQPYAVYLDPNPRSIKRLLNFYAVYRELILIEGRTAIDRSQLVRWLILTMRWPILAEYLSENSDHIQFIGAPEKLTDLNLTSELQSLFTDKAVIELVTGKITNENRIDAGAIGEYADLL